MTERAPQTITRDNLLMPTEAMERFYKTVTTPMFRVHGPITIATQEGPYHLPDDWDGWCAVDRAGYPYPISVQEHKETYASAAQPEPVVPVDPKVAPEHDD